MFKTLEFINLSSEVASKVLRSYKLSFVAFDLNVLNSSLFNSNKADNNFDVNILHFLEHKSMSFKL